MVTFTWESHDFECLVAVKEPMRLKNGCPWLLYRSKNASKASFFIVKIKIHLKRIRNSLKLKSFNKKDLAPPKERTYMSKDLCIWIFKTIIIKKIQHINRLVLLLISNLNFSFGILLWNDSLKAEKFLNICTNKYLNKQTKMLDLLYEFRKKLTLITIEAAIQRCS